MLTRNEYVKNLRRIYVASQFYSGATEIDQGRIYDACSELFDLVDVVYDRDPASVSDSVVDSGLDRSFGVLLLLSGDVFLKRQFDCSTFDEFVEKFVL